MSSAGVIRFGGVGDNLITSSIFPLLREKYDYLEVISSDPCHVVFENNPYVSRVIKKDYRKVEQDWCRDRAEEYDFFINLSTSIEGSLVIAKTQLQFDWPIQFRRRLCQDSYLERVHDICGLPHIFAPKFFPTQQESTWAACTKTEIGDRVIGWVVSGTRIDKTYPWASFVIARLIRELAPVVLLGNPDRDSRLIEAIRTDVKNQNGTEEGLYSAFSGTNVGSRWSVRRVLTFIQHCDLVVGPDTGPMWAVAISSIPKILLLSHASVENITKHWVNTTTLHAHPQRVPCWPCHRMHEDASTCVINEQRNSAACMADISAESVMISAYDLWQSRPTSTSTSIAELVPLPAGSLGAGELISYME